VRGVVGPKAPLELKPVYTALELARSLGISRRRFMRLLEMQNVFIYRLGRVVLVPATEVRDKLQPLWASLLASDQKRREVDESSRSFRSGDRTRPWDP
jgi:hypothetical protein